VNREKGRSIDAAVDDSLQPQPLKADNAAPKDAALLETACLQKLASESLARTSLMLLNGSEDGLFPLPLLTDRSIIFLLSTVIIIVSLFIIINDQLLIRGRSFPLS
jgi:hypothetical protein